MIDENKKLDPFFCDVLDKNNKTTLADLFNYYIHNPESAMHAAEFWRNLKKNINAEGNSAHRVETVISDKSIELDLKYMLLDSFGCSVPPFIGFDVILEDNLRKKYKQFKSIQIKFKKGYLPNREERANTREVHSGW